MPSWQPIVFTIVEVALHQSISTAQRAQHAALKAQCHLAVHALNAGSCISPATGHVKSVSSAEHRVLAGIF